MVLTPEDINATVAAILVAQQTIDFSRYSSLLEVAFALNISYAIIPKMNGLGSKNAKRIEDDAIKDWQLDIKDTDDPAEKATIGAKIHLVEDISDNSTWMLTLSTWLTKFIAPVAALLSVLLLFFGATGTCMMETVKYRELFQCLIVLVLLAPNSVAIILQLFHWKSIRKSLEKEIKKANTKIK